MERRVQNCRLPRELRFIINRILRKSQENVPPENQVLVIEKRRALFVIRQHIE